MTATVYGGPVTDEGGDRLGLREAASRLGVSHDWARDLVRMGKIPAEFDQESRVYWVRPADIDAYLAARRASTPDPGLMVAELGKLAALAEAAHQRAQRLFEERDRALVRYVEEEGHQIKAAATAAGLTRYQAKAILQHARDRLAEDHAKHQQ